MHFSLTPSPKWMFLVGQLSWLALLQAMTWKPKSWGLCNLYLVIPSSLKWASKVSLKVKRKKACVTDFYAPGCNMVPRAQPNCKEAGKCSLAMYPGRRWPDVVGSFSWSALEFLNRQTGDVKKSKFMRIFVTSYQDIFVYVAEFGLEFAFILVYNLVERQVVAIYLYVFEAIVI